MVRLREEKDRYADQNSKLLAAKTDLKQALDRCGLYKENISQLKREFALQSGEAECLKKEKEVLTSENEDLQNENEARRIEVYTLHARTCTAGVK
jgi:FtsZ-binding cell division protein ZapB